MTRSQIIQRLNEKYPDVPLKKMEDAVNLFFNHISSTLAEDGRVEIRGFGVFTLRQRQARAGRNPKTGEDVLIPEKKVPFFKPGKLLKNYVNSE